MNSIQPPASKLIIYAFLLVSLLGCKKKAKEQEDSTVSVTGKAQKGPYKNGTPLTIFELNSSLGQTGKSFASVINDDAGNFSMNNIGLTTGFALVTANGFYYMEHFNVVSPNQLYLESVCDVSGTTTVNVNLLTHLIKPRIDYLVTNGASFSSAKTQAQNEFRQFMGASTGGANFETLDISNNGFLFAVSLLFQRPTAGYITSYNYTSELSALLNNFRNDFKNNGAIDSPSIVDTLIHNANRIELIDVKNNLQSYFSNLGITITPPNFETVIYDFQKKYSSPLYTSITFQDTAVYMHPMGGPSKMRNLLYKQATNFQTGSFLLSAIVPCDSSLKIKFTQYLGNGSYSIFPPYYGWKVTSSTGVIELECQRKNFQNGLMLQLSGPAGQDSAKVEYFQNNSPTPYFTKTVYW